MNPTKTKQKIIDMKLNNGQTLEEVYKDWITPVIKRMKKNMPKHYISSFGVKNGKSFIHCACGKKSKHGKLEWPHDKKDNNGRKFYFNVW